MTTSRTIFPLFFGSNASATKLGDGTFNPLQLVRLHIEQQVNADFPLIHQVATTMTFLNSENRVLEGALQFTLPDTATICGYGLDVDGQIVDGVVVEKQAARIAFEKEVRKGVDPGFVESVGGNVFRTRVYPIRPRQTRIVRVIYQDQAKSNSTNNGLIFHIPIQFSQRLESFDLVLRCFSQTTTSYKPSFINGSPLQQHTYPSFLANSAEQYVAEWRLTHVEPPLADRPYIEYMLSDVLKPVMLAVELDPTVGAYFAVSLTLPSNVLIDPSSSKSICILWDASLSRTDAPAARTLELNALKGILDSWLLKFHSISLSIVIFRNDMEEPKSLSYRSDSWLELKKIFDDVIYDGTTNLAQLTTMPSSQMITHYFLFSDCISTLGLMGLTDDSFERLSAPVWIFNGNGDHQPIDHGFIRYLTERKYGGGYFDHRYLTHSAKELTAAVDQMQMEYVGLRTSDSYVCHVYPSHRIALPSNRDRFLLVGQVAKPLPMSIQCELEFAFNQQTCRVPFSCDISNNPAVAHFGLIRRQWAQQKLQELSAAKDKHRREIIALGIEYSLVTDFTSLMVLETLQQHLQYRICPAKTRTKLYEDYLTHQRAEDNKKPNKADLLNSSWKQYCAWYDRVITDVDRHRAFVPVTHLSPFYPPVQNFLFGTTSSFAAVPPMAAAPTFTVGASAAPMANDAAANVEVEQAKSGAFVLHDYNPQISLISRLQSAASLDSAYAMYLSERSTYRQSPSFYFDVASFFFVPRFTSSVLDVFNQKQQQQQQQPEPRSITYAIRILTNILELELEAPQLLRTIVYKLMEVHRADLALELCRKICELRPDEPQSLRDLALALMELGQNQQALGHLKQILDNVWDGRFNAIETIALVDFNRLVAKIWNRDASILAIDRRFLRSLPLDIRVVLEWDEPDTSLMLSVTEPTGQVCSVQQSQTGIGGSVAGTSGLLSSASKPQQYVLRTAIAGSYIIHVTLNRHTGQVKNGATTAVLYMYKYYGSDNEERHIRAIRLTELNQQMEIGRIEFGDPTLAKLQEELKKVKDENRRFRDQLNGSTNFDPSLIRHENVGCDACGTSPIAGGRYKCLFCPNLDFCQDCQLFSSKLTQFHDIQHPMIYIRDSSLYTNSLYAINRSGIIHTQTQCSACSASPIVGIRHRCTQCGTDLCERCEFLGIHDPTHQRVKLIYPQ